jgi:hypothetical protein
MESRVAVEPLETPLKRGDAGFPAGDPRDEIYNAWYAVLPAGKRVGPYWWREDADQALRVLMMTPDPPKPSHPRTVA